MSRTPLALEELLRSHPEEREALLPYVERAKRYANECGCAMGGGFLVVSLVGEVTYILSSAPFARASLVVAIIEGAAVVFAASVLGKGVGIGIARIRLELMHRELTARHQVERSQGWPPVRSG